MKFWYENKNGGQFVDEIPIASTPFISMECVVISSDEEESEDEKFKADLELAKRLSFEVKELFCRLENWHGVVSFYTRADLEHFDKTWKIPKTLIIETRISVWHRLV